MKRYLISKLFSIGLFVITSLITESFLFLFLGIGVLPQYWFIDLFLMLIISSLIFIIPIGKLQNITISIIVALQIIISYVNICIYQMLNDVFSFEMITLVGETADVITLDMLPLWPAIFYLALFALMIVAMQFIKKYKVDKSFRDVCAKIIIKDIALIALTVCFFAYSVTTTYALGGRDKDDERYFLSDEILYNTFSHKKQALAKFGTYGFYFEEFFRMFYKVNTVTSYTVAELEEYIESEEYDPTQLELYGVCEGDNVIMIMLESFEWYGISPELTPTLYALMHGYDFGERNNETGLYSRFNYYTFGKDSNGFTTLKRNDYTYSNGKYEKIELLGTPVEILDEEKFDEYGLALVNYYSKTKTDYAEASSILGNYPYNDSFSTHNIFGYGSNGLYTENNYSYTLPNMLKGSGSVDVANYLHTYNSTFYGRDMLMPQFGFDNTKFLNQTPYIIEKGDSLSHAVRDSNVLDYYLNNSDSDYNYLPLDKSFFSFFTTVTTHGEYTYNPLLAKNYEFVDSVGFLGQTVNGHNEINISDEIESNARTYLASCLDTEYMVTILVKYLMENNLFDNTTLVMFADHHCYYEQMQKEYKKYYFNDEVGYSSPIAWLRDEPYGEVYNTTNSPDMYKIPACIYSTKIDDSVVGTEEGSHDVKKFTCSFDLPVTIYTLLGIDYTTTYYLGYPVICEVFDEESGEIKDLGMPAFISSTGGVFNDKIFTEDGNFTDKSFAKSMINRDKDGQEFSRMVSELIDKWYKITALYEYDMFKVVWEK